MMPVFVGEIVRVRLAREEGGENNRPRLTLDHFGKEDQF